MRRPKRSSLYWRLLPSYLLVILVAAGTAFLAGEAVAPFFLQRHVDVMMDTLHTHADQSLDEMADDLEAGFRRALTQSLLWALLASGVAATIVGFYVTRRVVNPLKALTKASRRIAGGQYSQRLTSSAPGEIGELAAAFNTMAGTLQHSEERRIQLMADVAHEFRTPLSNLRGYLEGLEDSVFQPEELAGPANRQLRRLERLADDLSLLSRVETGQVNLNPEQLSATDLLTAVTEAFRPAFETKGVNLTLNTTGGHKVWADSERTEQILSNLITNALRFTPPDGTVTLQVEPADNGLIRFEVIDTGIGIPEEQLQHVFNRFYRGDQSRAPHPDGGTGIGLTITKQLAERQGGTIGVSSTPGQGSRFWFELPAAATKSS